VALYPLDNQGVISLYTKHRCLEDTNLYRGLTEHIVRLS
jgi:hypothetical protein